MAQFYTGGGGQSGPQQAYYNPSPSPAQPDPQTYSQPRQNYYAARAQQAAEEARRRAAMEARRQAALAAQQQEQARRAAQQRATEMARQSAAREAAMQQERARAERERQAALQQRQQPQQGSQATGASGTQRFYDETEGIRTGQQGQTGPQQAFYNPDGPAVPGRMEQALEESRAGWRGPAEWVAAAGRALQNAMDPNADDRGPVGYFENLAENLRGAPLNRPGSGDFLHWLMSQDPVELASFGNPFAPGGDIRNFPTGSQRQGQDAYAPGGENRPGFFMGGQYGGFRPSYRDAIRPGLIDWDDPFGIRAAEGRYGIHSPDAPRPYATGFGNVEYYAAPWEGEGGRWAASNGLEYRQINPIYGVQTEEAPAGGGGGGGGYGWPSYGGGYGWPGYSTPEAVESWFEKMTQWRI